MSVVIPRVGGQLWHLSDKYVIILGHENQNVNLLSLSVEWLPSAFLYWLDIFSLLGKATEENMADILGEDVAIKYFQVNKPIIF